MQTHNLQQGSSLWHEFRADHFGASEAASMLGLSKQLSRNDLLLYKKTGKSKEYSEWVQKNILDYGHEVEAKAREILEQDIGDELYPVTCSLGKLSASCDGLTIDGHIAFEHKQYSKSLADYIVENNALPDSHMPQCQQILLVTGAQKVIFVCSDGTGNNKTEISVFPDQSWFDRIEKGWNQFEKDLEMYEPKEFADKPESAAIMQLPALSVYTKGDIVVHGNLDAFKEASDKYIASINRDLKTDEDFVNAEAAIKRCKEVEQNIKNAKATIIGGIASVDEATRLLDYIDDSHSKTRLFLEKIVKSQKEAIKKNIIDAGLLSCGDHMHELSKEIFHVNFAFLSQNLFSRQQFELCCKSLRTLSSLHNAVDTEVAAIKIKLDDLARVVRKNLAHLPEDLSIFRDLQSIITKPEDDFKLLVESRLAEQKRKEEEAAQRAIAEAKAKEEAEAARVAAAQEQKKPDPEPFEVVPAVKRYAAAAPIVRPVEPIREKSFLVLMQRYEDLTDEEKDDASSNGCGKEYASYIRVLHNGETQLLKNDAVEPEDATFSRDFNWVLSAIREAYVLGVKDGKQSLNQDTAA